MPSFPTATVASHQRKNAQENFNLRASHPKPAPIFPGQPQHAEKPAEARTVSDGSGKASAASPNGTILGDRFGLGLKVWSLGFGV